MSKKDMRGIEAQPTENEGNGNIREIIKRIYDKAADVAAPNEEGNIAMMNQRPDGHTGMVRCEKCFHSETECGEILGHLQFKRCVVCWEKKEPCKK